MVDTLNTISEVRGGDNIGFDYKFVPVGKLQVETAEDPQNGKLRVTTVLVEDEPIKPSNRFWLSLFARYGFNSAFFKYFDHHEVFKRISERESNDRMRICIERGDRGSRLLAVSNPAKPISDFDDLHCLISQYDGNKVSYSDGLIESFHKPRNFGNFEIAGDVFSPNFLLSYPIDGYGTPSIYLAMVRLICENGAVAYTKMFRSSLSLGKGIDDVRPSMMRALESFGSQEGYEALQQRIESSQKSWASIYEATVLQQLLFKLYSKGTIDDSGGSQMPSGVKIVDLLASSVLPTSAADHSSAVFSAPILRAYNELVGDPSKLYGIANMDALSVKRQRTLPVKSTVYDLINFATEVATHYAEPSAARQLQGWVGNTVSCEYDMENTCDKFSDFKDFHVGKSEDFVALTA